MRELYELKEKVYDELKNYGKKDLTASTLGTVKDLTKTAYYLCELIEEEEDGGYSNAYGNRNRSYAGGRGGSRRESRREMRRESRRNSYDDGYSYDGSVVEELRDMMDDVQDDRKRQEFQRFIQKMESM